MFQCFFRYENYCTEYLFFLFRFFFAGYFNPVDESNNYYACSMSQFSVQKASACDYCGNYDQQVSFHSQWFKKFQGCKHCPVGTYFSWWEGSTLQFCPFCSPGSSNGIRSVLDINADDYSQTSCQSCPTHTFSSSDTGACEPCPPGHYSPSTGSASCLPCPQGSFKSESMNTCEPCSYSVAVGALICVSDSENSICNEGDYLTVDGSCEQLPSGTASFSSFF